jgi:hypothetical protein
MPGVQIQDFLFQRIREKLPSHEALVDVVAGLLFVSNDSAYRRIRGETPLVLEEAKILCDAFSISLDGLLNAKPNTISFSAFEVDQGGNSFGSYLEGIHAGLLALNSAENKELFYLTKDVPLFYNFLYRPLFAFRYFFWMKSILQHPDFLSAHFSMDLLPANIEEKGKEIAMLYNAIPSTEIWNTECINSTISQIEYYREAGYFRSENDVVQIYEAVLSLIEHLRYQAELGCKFLPGESYHSKKDNFKFFYNRVVLGDNTIIAVAQGKKTMYLGYDVLNYMMSQDERLCNSTYEKLQMLMRRATLISKASDKQRNIFFNILLKKIPELSTINSFK